MPFLNFHEKKKKKHEQGITNTEGYNRYYVTERSYLLMESPVSPVSFRTFATHAYRGLAPKPWTATMLHLISEYKDIRHDIPSNQKSYSTVGSPWGGV
jgi:hypothetical protein